MFSRRRPPEPPERSRALRAAVLLASLPPLLAVAWSGALWGEVLLAGLLLAGGHTYAWRAAQEAGPIRLRPTLVKLAVFVGLHLALGWMCLGFSLGVNLPQAQFAMYAQAITAFDLRRRTNLYSSLGLGLLNLYVAATLARDYFFLLLALAFLILVLRVFYLAEAESGRAGARLTEAPPRTSRAPRPTSAGLLTGLAGLSLLAASLVFVVTPRFAGRPLIPPFSINLPIRRGAAAQVVNPAVPLVQINGIYEPDTEGDYYYGFDTQLDLRYRGRLSDDIVMYVRSPAWSYWRSHSYDTYSGYSWSQSDTRVTRLGRQGGITFRIDADSQALGEEFAQSFYIVRDQPNLIFGAYRPTYLIINSEEVVQDRGEGLRAGQPLQAGMAYTVISRRPDFTPEQLRAAAGSYPPEVAVRYLQLPESLSPRVRGLARELTAGAPTAFDKAAALRDYLLTLPYDFFPPPAPPGAETVDNFLFVDRRGVCEQFATAHVVLLRTLGIPARVVAGYGAGEYNPLSGYYTVRASDAHAWSEVYFPGYGWVPFDATPGWTPAPYTQSVKRWMLSGSLEGLPGLPWAQFMTAGAGLMNLTLGPLLLVGALAAGGAAMYAVWRRLRRRLPAPLRTLDDDPRRRRILQAYRAGQRRLRLARPASLTPREFALRLGRADWDVLTAAVERAAYDTQPPGTEMARQAEAVVARLPRRPWLTRANLLGRLRGRSGKSNSGS